MKQYRLLESRAGKIGFGVFLFAMLLLARDTLITSCLLGFNKSQFLMLGLICVMGVFFLMRNFRELKSIVFDRRMLAAIASAVILLLPMLIKQDWQIMYFSILICLFFAIFLTYFASYKDVAKYYVIILAVLCVYSLIGSYYLKKLADAGKILVPVFTNDSDWPFYNFGLSFAVTWEYWHRNFGIFREPGVYQFFILIALYLNNYAIEWKKPWMLWLINAVLAITMLSTFAVGGVIELALFAVFAYFDRKWYKNGWGKIVGVLTVIAVFSLVTHIIIQLQSDDFYQSIYFVFYDMFVRLTSGTDSLVDRLDAIFTNLQFIFQHPIFGDKIASVLHGTNHNTSSTLILYAIFGVVGGTLNVAAWVALAWKKERHWIGNLFLLLILFMSFNTQNLVADVFFWLFPFMALIERGLPLLKLPEGKVR